MAVNINLLPEVKSEEKKKQQVLQKVNLIAISVAGVLVAILISSIVVRTVLAGNLSKVNSEIQTQENMISDELETETALVGLQSRVEAINDVLTQRKKYSVFLTNLSSYIPQAIKITDITLSTDDFVTIAGEAPNYEKLAGFILLLSGEQNMEASPSSGGSVDVVYSNVKIMNVAKTEESSSIKFTLTFTAEEGAFNE